MGKKFLIVGAGLSGSVLANSLAMAGHSVEVVDSRKHLGGNCFTSVDKMTNIVEHIYGPHIFHTADFEVWKFVNKHLQMIPYNHQVVAQTDRGVFSLPVNLLTINQVFGKVLSPAEAENFVKALRIGDPDFAMNFEERALSLVGIELYELFFKGYTSKQWGRAPVEIPASVFSRLPLRYDYRNSYFDHPFQAIPEDGYTPLFEKLLDHPLIEVSLGVEVSREAASGFQHAFWSGPIDLFYDHDLGRLPYRTLDFSREVYDSEFQGAAVVNYTSESIPYTRTTEHRYFAPWRTVSGSIVYREFSRECGEDDLPYYPVRTASENRILTAYLSRAEREVSVSFVGRLGTFRYLDMDVCIREALEAGRQTLDCLNTGTPIPVFFQ